MKPRTVDDVIASTPRGGCEPLHAPPYVMLNPGPCLGFAVESMSRHMTDEGWQLFLGLQDAGYKLYGKNLDTDNVALALERERPGTVLVQDKREWQGRTADRSGEIALRNVGALWTRDDVFKGTVLKDAQHDAEYNRKAAEEIGCHFWVHYYHPRIVAHLSPFVRPQHLVRTHHSLDASLVPPFNMWGRDGVLMSGAVSSAYPLRKRMWNLMSGSDWPSSVSGTILSHPGYHRRGCETPEYLKTLSRHKVAICTSSRYGYAVRKIMEATACGCSVLTDLPVDEVLPGIDENLVRIHPDLPMTEIADVIRRMVRDWNPERQQYYADCAKITYDYREQGKRLADDIEKLRRSYDQR